MAKRILVIDDEVELVEMVKMRLEAAGYEVITATSGKDGLEQAESEKPDLILLDIMMPEMDGFAVLNKLRASPKTQTIPAIMLTAKGEMNAITKAQDLRARDYIIKPFDSEELLKVVRRYTL